MTRGKRQAARSGRQMSDPFAQEIPAQKTSLKRPKKKKKRKTGLILGGLVAAGLAVFLVCNFFFKKPDVSDNNRPGVANNNPNDPNSGALGAESGAAGGRKEDYYTFLLLGRDTGGGGNTDTLILVSYDVPNQQVNMMSIPRDTAINVSWSTKKINSVYNAKESSGGGLENLKEQVAYLTGVMPDFYVIIEWKAVGKIVDAVGGVEFDVPRNMNYDDPYQNLSIHLNKGIQTLTGQKAMEMLRYRHDNDPNVGYNDTGRMETQRAFLKAMAKEVLKLKNMTKIGEFINIFMENVTTDLKLSDLTWFASKALGVDTDTIQSSTLPYFDVGTFHGGAYLLPNPEEIVTLVNEQFNPYNREITQDDLRVIVRRDDGSCYVPGGTLLDASWGKSYSGSKVSTAGGGVTTEKSTGVVASPVTPSSSGGSSSGNSSSDNSSSGNSSSGGSTEDKPAQTVTTEEGGTTAEPNVEPGNAVEPPDSAPDSQPPDNNTDAEIPTDTDPGQEPEQNPDPIPEPEPEPELPPEPVLPPDETDIDLAA